MKINEVVTRNPNKGTLVEVVMREDGKNIVERLEKHESGTYETAEQKRARHTDSGACTPESDEGLQGS